MNNTAVKQENGVLLISVIGVLTSVLVGLSGFFQGAGCFLGFHEPEMPEELI